MAAAVSMTDPIFHLAFPVHELDSTRSFYLDLLGARPGRSSDTWLDVFLWGAQITLHQRPDDVPEDSAHGVRHFGATLEWNEWQRLVESLSERDVRFIASPKVSNIGTPVEQAKLMIADPSGNRIEVKAYRDPGAALKFDDVFSA